jgi:hypothetical protein
MDFVNLEKRAAAFQALAHATDEHRALVAEAVARVAKSRKG